MEDEDDDFSDVSLDMPDGTEDDLMNMSEINKSSEDIYVTTEDANGSENTTTNNAAAAAAAPQANVERPILNFYNYLKNVDARKYMEVTPGVAVSPLNEIEGYMRLEPDCVSKTARHEKDLTMVVLKGTLLISLNNTKSLHRVGDIIHVPSSKFCCC